MFPRAEGSMYCHLCVNDPTPIYTLVYTFDVCCIFMAETKAVHTHFFSGIKL